MNLKNSGHRSFSSSWQEVHSSLLVQFFGPNLNKQLSLESFLDFRQRLNCTILKYEFLHWSATDKQTGESKISDVDFAKMLLMHSRLSKTKQRKMIARVKRLCVRKPQYSTTGGFQFKEVLTFFEFLNELTDVETALQFYHLAGAAIDQATFRHIVHNVANKPLSDHMIDVIFNLFDEDQDGKLSYKEFVKVMKRRFKFGFANSRELGIFRRLNDVYSYFYNQIRQRM
ncbi:unnamed protein product [Soboliphyme baturini]|uniref:EF-hand domain-containing protein n=1 Tax=Soboliphyme baturini TaxID=241478 RepID=A0A183IQA6_9BILA|nr:unnamed protein product [Soboliphyme baturini]